MKNTLLLVFLLISYTSFSQTLYENKSGIYSFKMSDKFNNQASNHERNEFVFVNWNDTTSLVVNVNNRSMNKGNLDAFKKASNSEVETNYFTAIKNPKIVQRGEISNYKDQSIYFHVTHNTKVEAENNYMITYLFYHKGKEINFIFRTRERRLEKVSQELEEIINSVKLL